jgi:hypothetical protein
MHSPLDLTREGTVFQIGVAPNRVDILTSATGLEFGVSLANSTRVPIEGITVPVLSREDFRRNKQALGRPRDLADLALLDENPPG